MQKLSHCRVLIENTIGLLKQRFRQLYNLKSRNIDFICHFLLACCVLHNMCTDDDIFEGINFEEMENRNVQNDNYEEVERNEVGLNYRTYVAAMLNI
ncbi:hypothetical protein NQ314_002833 [Rhamnusium bicolor]|uniref:DDE Tnp4 domain-containing protein n=1 Tax=Rhamnusium bicolor TaxID=1586634 RepID=A0AAV8ZNR2_9CUCU|nr:hypothetical protein NQ314_002833 [Rhamnusium bicolor]